MRNIIKSQPPALYILFLWELCIRFAYWGTLSLIVLYITKSIHAPSRHMYTLYGIFTSLSFAFSFVGGVIADKLVGSKLMVLSSAILMLLALIALSFHSQVVIIIGLALVCYATGIFAPTAPSLLGSFYKNDGQYNRSAGFTFYYLGTNVGGILGPIVFGVIAKFSNYHFCFILSAILLGISLLLGLTNHKLLSHDKRFLNLSMKRLLLYALLTLGMIVVTILLMSSKLASDWFLNAMAIIAVLCLVLLAVRHKAHRKNYLLIGFIICMPLIFFTFEFQVYSSILVFIKKHIDTGIPVPVFAGLEPMFVAVLGPFVIWAFSILQRRNISFTDRQKIPLGMFIAAIGFGVLTILASIDMINYLAITLIFIVNLLLGLGELLIMPNAMALINKVAPDEFKSTSMGIFYLPISYAGYLSGYVATLTTGYFIATSKRLNPFTITYGLSILVFLVVGFLSIMLFRYFKASESP